jgi:murein DD-endopeptidase MepM/ murein hydrolase activator NlpD
MIDHNNGYLTVYGHLSQINVSACEGVSAGTGIGLAGSTGNSTGPHLHFEIRQNGSAVDPWYLLPAP